MREPLLSSSNFISRIPSKIEPKRLVKLSFIVVFVADDDEVDDCDDEVVSTKIAVASTSFKRKYKALTNCNTSSSLKIANKCVKESTTRHIFFLVLSNECPITLFCFFS